MALILSPEQAAKIILEAAVIDGMRPPQTRKHFSLRARAIEHGVGLDDFPRGIDYAVAAGWLEHIGDAFFRLTEAGFAVTANPPAASTVLPQGKAQTSVTVSSEGQSSGITAKEVHFHGPATIHGPRLTSVSAATPEPQKAPWWKSWWAVVSGLAILLAGVVPTLDYMHIEWPWHHQSKTAPKATEAPQSTPSVQSAPGPKSAQHLPAKPTTELHSRRSHEWKPTLVTTQPMAKPQSSVSSQNQSGGITAGTVNIYGEKQQRHLNQQGIDFLAQHIPKAAQVTVTAVMGDGDAFTYAQEITNWMRGNGWTNVSGVNQAIFSAPVLGQGINPKPDGSFDIQIGNQR